MLFNDGPSHSRLIQQGHTLGVGASVFLFMVDDYHQAVLAAKRQIVMKAIERSGGNFTAAAKDLGLHPNNLHRLVNRLQLRSTLPK